MSQQVISRLQHSRLRTRLAPAQEAVFGGVPMMERFRRMTPPFFKGESDPIHTESWLRETEKIFRALRCAEEERVTLATYMLQAKIDFKELMGVERADVWWSSVLRTQFEDGAMERAVVPARAAAQTPGGGMIAEKPVCTQCGKRHGGERLSEDGAADCSGSSTSSSETDNESSRETEGSGLSVRLGERRGRVGR
ncbi:hypothetical protein Taro_026946, partial [Colocasia esculenta]|nr:hypothetical protein [Colocasia esculenta]